MILVRLMGGLGNQMFQYAFGRALSIKYSSELVLDTTLLEDRSLPNEIATYRNFDLDIFKNLNYRLATPKEIVKYNGDANASIFNKILRKLGRSGKLIVQKNNETQVPFEADACYVGRWQSYKFFKDIQETIKTEFTLKEIAIPGLGELIDKIKSTNSVCVHVRRSDLVTSSLYSKTIGTIDISYYNQALQFMNKEEKNATYFIFSDDIEWCKSNLNSYKEAFFVDSKYSGNKAEGHFYLMKLCKHFIISNSTFAWWAAFLSEESKQKKVIYPKNWYKDAALHNPDMSPVDWKAI